MYNCCYVEQRPDGDYCTTHDMYVDTVCPHERIAELEQENARLREAADVVVKTYDYVTGWTTEMDNAVCDLIRILESSDG